MRVLLNPKAYDTSGTAIRFDEALGIKEKNVNITYSFQNWHGKTEIFDVQLDVPIHRAIWICSIGLGECEALNTAFDAAIAILLVLVLLANLVSCGGSVEEPKTQMINPVVEVHK